MIMSGINELLWDAHCCVPLLPSTLLAQLLKRHHQSGFSFVSVNIGMDMIPLDRILSVAENFCEEIRKTDYLVLARSAQDVAQASRENRLAISFDLEGGTPFFESEYMVELFSRLGLRQTTLAYNRNNLLAGGCFDTDMGLTESGKKIISAMSRHGIIIDCSHMGFRSSIDVMCLAKSPVIFSHSNAFAVTKSDRNIYDYQIKACAQTGGVICVSGLSWLLGEEQPSVDGLIRHIDYIANLVGIEHVGLGLDYIYEHQVDDIPKGVDLKYWWPRSSLQGRQFKCSFIPPEEISSLAAKLLRMYSKEEAKKILGLNMLRIAEQVWTSNK